MKRAIDEQVLRRLHAARPDAGRELDRTRMLFLLSFMLRGIPFVDIAYLRKCDLQGDMLVYRRRKTGAWMTVKVEPEAMRLIERLKTRNAETGYLFPFIDKTGPDAYRQYQSALRAFNGRLKRLGAVIGLSESLSSYCARHSCHHCQLSRLPAGTD